ncbi:MAG: hypothetical protein OHK0054_05980 [Sideroxydans sp.]
MSRLRIGWWMVCLALWVGASSVAWGKAVPHAAKAGKVEQKRAEWPPRRESVEPAQGEKAPDVQTVPATAEPPPRLPEPPLELKGVRG